MGFPSYISIEIRNIVACRQFSDSVTYTVRCAERDAKPNPSINQSVSRSFDPLTLLCREVTQDKRGCLGDVLVPFYLLLPSNVERETDNC